MTFEQWMIELDKVFVKQLGMDSSCFEDWNYYIAWEDGLTPREAYKSWLEENL